MHKFLVAMIRNCSEIFLIKIQIAFFFHTKILSLTQLRSWYGENERTATWWLTYETVVETIESDRRLTRLFPAEWMTICDALGLRATNMYSADDRTLPNAPSINSSIVVQVIFWHFTFEIPWDSYGILQRGQPCAQVFGQYQLNYIAMSTLGKKFV